jgi:hypothetical protein
MGIFSLNNLRLFLRYIRNETIRGDNYIAKYFKIKEIYIYSNKNNININAEGLHSPDVFK